jgi:hypothetical protein
MLLFDFLRCSTSLLWAYEFALFPLVKMITYWRNNIIGDFFKITVIHSPIMFKNFLSYTLQFSMTRQNKSSIAQLFPYISAIVV